EQIRGDPVGPATDIYALGALAYTLLAGKPAFGEGAPGEVLRRQLTGRPRSLRALRPQLPLRVEHAIISPLPQHPLHPPAPCAPWCLVSLSSGRQPWQAARLISAFAHSCKGHNGGPTCTAGHVDARRVTLPPPAGPRERRGGRRRP